jgi:hypothetical protein
MLAGLKSDPGGMAMLKPIVGLTIFGVLSVLGAPASARVAVIETAVALADDSERALDAAVAEAMDTVARGASAMGLTHLELKRAFIVEHTMVIRILATDSPAVPAPGATPAPRESPSPDSDDPAHDLVRPRPGAPSGGTAQRLEF